MSCTRQKKLISVLFPKYFDKKDSNAACPTVGVALVGGVIFGRWQGTAGRAGSGGSGMVGWRSSGTFVTFRLVHQRVGGVTKYFHQKGKKKN